MERSSINKRSFGAHQLTRYYEFMAPYKIGRLVLFFVLAPSCDGQAERFQDKSS